MPYRNTVGKTIVCLFCCFWVLAFFALIVEGGSPNGGESPNWVQLWMAKSGGVWKIQKRYGYYKVLVFREGLEHSQDRVLIQITEADPPKNTQRIIHSYWLKSPGIKGYIADIQLSMIDSQRMALSLDIEMKAMDGIILKEIYLLFPDGRQKLVNEAKYTDIYD
ncbi:MAG: hypothetical protein WAO55_03860 [Candidatus Manganitrophaceae bacterium]